MTVIMANVNKIVWNAPSSATAQKEWWAFKNCLLSSGPLTRIILASVAITALILVGFKLAIPALVIPNLSPLLFVLPMLLGMLALQTYLITKVDKRVIVTPEKILIQSSSCAIIRTEWLSKVALAIHDNERLRLRLTYEHLGRKGLKLIGAPTDLDILELERLLPIEIEARDYRRADRS